MLKDRGYDFFNVIGELRPGVTVQQAQRELDAIATHIALKKDDGQVSYRAGLYQEVLTGPVRRFCLGSSAPWPWCCSSPAPTYRTC